MLKEVNKLYAALNNLQYEGKIFVRRNIRNVFRSVRSIKKDLFPHMKFDDDKLFPFFQKHIPKYEPILEYFKGEHAEIREEFKALEVLFLKAEKAKTDTGEQKLAAKLRDHGIYLVCLVRNHLQVEGQNIYKMMRRLKAEEQDVLISKLSVHH